MVQEIDENRFRRHLGERFFRSGSFLCRLWGPTWVPDPPLWSDFRPTFATFSPTLGHHVFFLRSRVLGDSAGIDFGCLRVPQGASREGFLENFGSFSASLRSFVPPEFCSNFVPSLSKFQISRCSAVGSGLGWPALQLQGRWSRGAC